MTNKQNKGSRGTQSISKNYSLTTSDSATFSYEQGNNLFSQQLASKGITFSSMTESVPRTPKGKTQSDYKGSTFSYDKNLYLRTKENTPQTFTYSLQKGTQSHGVTPSHNPLNFTKNTLSFSKKTTTTGYRAFREGVGTQSHFEVKTQMLRSTPSNFYVAGTVSAAFSRPSIKKFYIKTTDTTPKLDAKSLAEFVSTLSKTTTEEATKSIKLNKVTVNGNLVTDPNHTLVSGDVVRVGSVGHYVNNNEGIAIVK
jgi:hypothetical protein